MFDVAFRVLDWALTLRSPQPRAATCYVPQVAHLKDRYRCVTVDLPGFSGDDVGVEKWGYTADEVVRRLERTVEAANNGEPVYLVAHDWGW